MRKSTYFFNTEIYTYQSILSFELFLAVQTWFPFLKPVSKYFQFQENYKNKLTIASDAREIVYII